MQKDLESIAAANMQMVGISYDSVDVLAKFAEQASISFPLLADEGSEVIEKYSLLNDTGRAKIAHPCTVIVGQDGVVKSKLYVDGFRNRHANDKLIEEAKKLGE